jgi:glutamine---fructose-6-phosphate transaminase (isomerizing)
MCGIFGIIASKESNYSEVFLSKALGNLAQLSQSRGKDSSGISAYNQIRSKLEVVKGPIPAKQLLQRKRTKEIVSSAFSKGHSCRYAFGHARLVTNGTQLNDHNNQPVIKDGIVGVHNGIVTNVDKLWETNKDINRQYEIDTEVLLALIRDGLNKNSNINVSTIDAISKVFGTVATAFVINDFNNFVLATNNGSLYTLQNNKDILFFASDKIILSNFAKKTNLEDIGEYEIKKLESNSGLKIDLEKFIISNIDFSNPKDVEKNIQSNEFPIDSFSELPIKEQISTVVDHDFVHLQPQAAKDISLLDFPTEKVKHLKRCSKCLLPETFPFIKFDEKGECNYCHNYKKRNLEHNLDELKKHIEPYRKNNRKPDVLIPFSGGRDSTYVMHIVKKELGLNPVAFTYDWGMVTDLARRNVARTCGELGVENIIVAADIHMKRRNIRNNVKAWLKKPELGMIPLLMAGDKYFFYYNNVIGKQYDLNLSIWGANYLENTDFKTGFCGIAPKFDKSRIDDVNSLSKVKLASFFARNFMTNPSYLNSSLYDTFGSFLSRYVLKRRAHFEMFDYVQWDEKMVNDIIINKYGWEKAPDTNTTWRVGDGTAAFYNYIYYRIAGFTEHDTFRSNQIRQGMITREEALKQIEIDNKPRYNSLKWYIEIIGLDFESTIKRINEIPSMF